MKLTSTAFTEGEEIPQRYTCQGGDTSPPLGWSEAPAGTRSFALIVDDPDAPDPKAPKMVYVHWVLANLPADSTGLPEAVTADALPKGTIVGNNDWKKPGYGGPCPPIGRHRYFHKLYALDAVLGVKAGVTKPDLLAAMKGHVIGEAQLVGTYQKIM